MGILEDAIREHLELKRQHGANEAELEQQETEALGPARREPAATEETIDAAAEHDVPAAPEEAPAAFEAGPPVQEPPMEPVPVDEPPIEAAPVEEPPADELEVPETALYEDAAAEPESAFDESDPFADERPLAPEPEPEPEPESARGQTPPRGFPAVSEDEAPEEAEEDVLEETPDFLQETPEHDRLWFEQKPPRDFDFD